MIAPARRAALAALVDITRGRADLDDAKTWATVSTAAFIGAGVAAASGVVLLVLSGGRTEERRAARVQPAIGPAAVGLHGVF